MILYQSEDPEEYFKTIDRIDTVLQKHLEPQNPKYPQDDACHFIGAYRSFYDDFWNKAKATEALEDLSRSLRALSSSFDAVPRIIIDDLAARATGMHLQRLETYYETSLDETRSKFPPKPNEQEAVEALRTLMESRSALGVAINATRKGLPQGIDTRNRPRKAYAVIHAAAEVCRSGSRIYVPKAVNHSGPMFRLLVDLFALFKVNNAIPGTYRGWRKHMYGKYENFDLLEI